MAIPVLLVGAFLGVAITGGLFRSAREEHSFNQTLVRVAERVNKTLPKTLDADTRLDSVSAGPAKKFTYFYTLPNQSKSELDAAQIQNALRPNIVAAYKTNEDLKDFRDHNVEMHYRYSDKNGQFLFEIVVASKDLK